MGGRGWLYFHVSEPCGTLVPEYRVFYTYNKAEGTFIVLANPRPIYLTVRINLHRVNRDEIVVSFNTSKPPRGSFVRDRLRHHLQVFAVCNVPEGRHNTGERCVIWKYFKTPVVVQKGTLPIYQHRLKKSGQLRVNPVNIQARSASRYK